MEAGSALLRVEAGEDVAQMVMRWRAVAKWPKPAPHVQLLVAEAGNVGDRFRAGSTARRQGNSTSSSGCITVPHRRRSGNALK
jgi:hypothetical protein